MVIDEPPLPEELIRAGMEIAELPHGNRAENLERSIGLLQAAVRQLVDADQPVLLALALYQLAMSVQERVLGTRSDNFDAAISYYEAAAAILSERTDSDSRHLLGQTLGNLGGLLLPARDDVEGSLRASHAALQLLSPEATPREWGVSQHNLGAAYVDREDGDREDNLRRAIAAFEAALTVRPEDGERRPRRLTLQSLDDARRQLADHLAECHDDDAGPTQDQLVAMVQRGIDSQLAGLRAETDATRRTMLTEAVEAFLAALETIDAEAESALWGTAAHNLGLSYILLDRDSDDRERGLLALLFALQARENAGDRLRWAMTQYNIAFAYNNRREGDPLENAEAAVRAAEQALDVLNQVSSPEHWAKASANLGNALLSRFELTGDEDDLRNGIRLVEIGFSHSDEFDSMSWPSAPARLAMAYRDLADREDNNRSLRLRYEALSALHLNEAVKFVGPDDSMLTADDAAAVAMLLAFQAQRDPGEPTEVFLDRARALLDRDPPAGSAGMRRAAGGMRSRLRNEVGRAYLRRYAGDRRDNAAEAARHFTTVLDDLRAAPASPERIAAYRGLGDAYIELGRPAEAAEQYRAIVNAYADADTGAEEEFAIVTALTGLHRAESR